MPVTVIAAADQLVLDDAIASRIPEDVPCRTFHCTDLDAEAVFSHLGTPDLFAENLCFHYSGIGSLKLRKAEAEGVERVLKNLPGNITLLCSELIEEEFASKRKQKLNSAEARRFSRHGDFIDLLAVSEPRNAPGWLQDWAKRRHGIDLGQGQAEKLYHTCGGSITLAGGELGKLALLKPGEDEIRFTDKTLDAVLSSSPETRFYDMLDGLLAGAPHALRQLREWYSTDQGTFRLVAEASRRLLSLMALREGRPVQPPYFARQLKPLERRYAGDRLDRAICACAALEHGLKSGAYCGENTEKAELAALELFQAELSSIQRC